jgi:hypothetical protein
MPLTQMVARLTTGLLMSFCSTAENYRWDNVAMGGSGLATGVIPTKSERGTQLMLGIGLPALVAGRRTSAR